MVERVESAWLGTRGQDDGLTSVLVHGKMSHTMSTGQVVMGGEVVIIQAPSNNYIIALPLPGSAGTSTLGRFLLFVLLV